MSFAKGREFTSGDGAHRRGRARLPRYTCRARIVVNEMTDFRQEFLDFALAREVLRFGEFITKAGRKTPYFFNAGLFSDGASLRRLGEFYAQALLASGIEYDQLFGPAYKGITLAAATAIGLAATGHNVPYSYNRKEAKDHGEGGTIVGAPLRGRVVIVDDVITAGTSLRESVAIIEAARATPAGVLIALDRMERGQGETSAVQDIRDTFAIPVASIATLDDVLAFIEAHTDLARYAPAIAAYRARYGTK
jgi:orotate phosphoribosyltransferase